VFSRKQTKTDQVRDLAVSVLSTAVDNGRRTVHATSGLTGTRAVATGAALYTAGRAVVTGGRAIRNRFGNGADEDDARDEAVTDEEYEEPEAEEEEDDFEDEDEEEPVAEE
jgi:hypothetical protein